MTESKKSSPAPRPSKIQQRRLARQREQRRTQITWAIGGIGVLAVIIAIVMLVSSNNPTGNTGIEGLESFTVQQGHTTEPVAYPQVPPVGGIHDPAWQNCGVYTQPVANENAVHSLEHGAIWITYQPDLPAAEVRKLQTLTRQSGYRLLSPYPGLPSPIVASAWGYQVKLENADDARLLQFIQRFEQDPRAPEPGAPCTGGFGQPE